ncbi:UNVERIFIED_CONTAM: hypothetical protein K2H54_024962 [Gekko kuhli]
MSEPSLSRQAISRVSWGGGVSLCGPSPADSLLKLSADLIMSTLGRMPFLCCAGFQLPGNCKLEWNLENASVLSLFSTTSVPERGDQATGPEQPGLRICYGSVEFRCPSALVFAFQRIPK